MFSLSNNQFENISQNIKKIQENDMIEINCDKSFQLVTDILLNGNHRYQSVKIPSTNISKCSNYNSFVKSMNELGLKVLCSNIHTEKACIYLGKDDPLIWFSMC